MISNNMPGFDDFPHDVGLLLHIASNKEKGRRDVVTGKNFQQRWSMRFVGTVVVREGKLF